MNKPGNYNEVIVKGMNFQNKNVNYNEVIVHVIKHSQSTDSRSAIGI